MGPCNQGLWGSYCIKISRKTRQCHVPHPTDSSRCLYFFADVPHLRKNLKGKLTQGDQIELLDDIVEKYKLPDRVVSLEHVEELLDLEEGKKFQLSPKLKKSCLHSSHYDKMKVGPAYSLLSHDTAAALHYNVQKGELDEEATTTAWFRDKMNTWFTLLTSRTRKQAERHLGVQGDAFFDEMISLFKNLKIVGKDSKWKPVQTGAVLATMSAKLLQQHLVTKEGFVFVLLSRFSQDALENFFSTLRMNNAVPSPHEFKCALRSAELSQFLRANPKGNYMCADGVSLVGIQNKQQSCSVVILHPTPETLENMVVDEGFRYVCRYAVSQLH